jgi:hypothetical protein
MNINNYEDEFSILKKVKGQLENEDYQENPQDELQGTLLCINNLHNNFIYGKVSFEEDFKKEHYINYNLLTRSIAKFYQQRKLFSELGIYIYSDIYYSIYPGEDPYYANIVDNALSNDTEEGKKYNIDEIMKDFNGDYSERVPDWFIILMIKHSHNNFKYDNYYYIYRQLRSTCNTSSSLRKLYSLWKAKAKAKDQLIYFLISHAVKELIDYDFNYANYSRLKLIYGLNPNTEINSEEVNNNFLTQQILTYRDNN